MKKTLILDLDGTLYYQLGVQLTMGLWLAFYYLIHFWRIKELMILKDYRKIREQKITDIVERQFKIIAKKYNVTEEEVKKIVNIWMNQKPLQILPIFKDKKLIKMINDYQENKGQVIIYSDYPTIEKLAVLKVKYDISYDSTHPKIRVLKPDSKGLNYIIKENNLKQKETYFIGDSFSKDGKCAQSCDLEYIILPKFFRRKKHIIIKNKIEIN